MLSNQLQCIIAKTAFFRPFRIIYRSYYNLVLWLTISILKGRKEVVSIYLTSSMATQECICGISDIDIIIITEDNLEKKDKIDKIYKMICCVTPIFRYEERTIYTTREIRDGYYKTRDLFSVIYFKYRLFYECRRTGRLLFGRDVLADFPAEGNGQKRDIILGNIAFVWKFLMKNFLLDTKKCPIVKNYLLYKLNADICKIYLFAKKNEQVFNRHQALELAGNELDGMQRAHVKKIQALSKNRFSYFDSNMLSKTYGFCLGLISDLYGYVSRSDKQVKKKKTFNDTKIGFGPLNVLISKENKQRIGRILNLVKHHYKDYVESILLAPFNLVGIDEENISLFIISKSDTPFNVIKELEYITRSCGDSQQLYLYTLSFDMALSLNGFTHDQAHSIILAPHMNPLIFLFLTNPGAAIYGKSLDCKIKQDDLIEYFLDFFSKTIRREKEKVRSFINNENIVRAPNIEFQRFFWQALQLIMIENSIALGRPVIPVSSEEVANNWNNLDIFGIDWLERFHNEYENDLDKALSRSDLFFSDAAQVLKKIYA